MGLDISVYVNAEVAEDQPADWEEAYDREENLVLAYCFDGMEQSLAGLERDVWYTADYDHGFRAGSYGGYNQFRRTLCELALGVTTDQVWDNPEEYADSPFFELINFADNEGTIGPVAALNLYVDFQAQQERIFEQCDDDSEYFQQLYNTWKEACKTAGQNDGIIAFH
jgi:hypothetical protein